MGDLRAAITACDFSLVKKKLLEITSTEELSEAVTYLQYSTTEIAEAVLSHPKLDPNENCPLLVCQKMQVNFSVFESILQHPDVDPNQAHVVNWNALHAAYQHNNDKEFIALCNHPKTNVNNSGMLRNALLFKRKTFALAMLRHPQYDPNLFNGLGGVIRKDWVEMARVMLLHPRIIVKNRWLTIAASSNDMDMLKLLLMAGADQSYLFDDCLSMTSDLFNWTPKTHHVFPKIIRMEIFQWLLLANRMKICKDIRLYLCKFIASSTAAKIE